MKDLVIIGAGRNLLDTLDIIDAINLKQPTWNVIGILDDSRPSGQDYCGHAVLGALHHAGNFPESWFASTIWNERVSRQLHDVLNSTGIASERYATLIHPRAEVSSRASLGDGVIINFGASIAGAVKISNLVSIGPGCIIGHDATIDSFSAVAAGAIISGRVHVERNCYIGSGSMLRQNIKVSEGALVGLGAVVVGDVPRMTTVVGNPARPITQTPGSTVTTK